MSPEERATVDKMAAREQRSSSNMARLIFLRGLEIVQQEQNQTA
ncbi:TPA: hypothetical protein JY305_005797 [Escherichia coli]|nr:hypothetical protein [Escherichia coli]